MKLYCRCGNVTSVGTEGNGPVDPAYLQCAFCKSPLSIEQSKRIQIAHEEPSERELTVDIYHGAFEYHCPGGGKVPRHPGA